MLCYAILLDGSKMAPRASQEAPRRPQEAPRRAQDGPKTAPRRPQDGLSSAKLPPSCHLAGHLLPSCLQVAFKMVPRASRSQLEAPRNPQEAPKMQSLGSTWPNLALSRHKLDEKNMYFLWEVLRFCIPTCVQYVAVRLPPGPRSAGLNPAAALGRYDRRLARSVRFR